jgi:hypothetical protein
MSSRECSPVPFCGLSMTKEFVLFVDIHCRWYENKVTVQLQCVKYRCKDRQCAIYIRAQGGMWYGVVHLELKAAGSFQIPVSSGLYGIISQKMVLFKTFEGLSMQTSLPYIYIVETCHSVWCVHSRHILLHGKNKKWPQVFSIQPGVPVTQVPGKAHCKAPIPQWVSCVQHNILKA